MNENTSRFGGPQGLDNHGPKITRRAVQKAIAQWSLYDNPEPLRALAAFEDGDGDLDRLVHALQPELNRNPSDPCGAADRLQAAGKADLAWLLRGLIDDVAR